MKLFCHMYVEVNSVPQALVLGSITNPVISIGITGVLVGIRALIDVGILIYNPYLVDGVGVKIWQMKHQKRSMDAMQIIKMFFGGKDNIDEPIDDAIQRYDYIEMKMIISIITVSYTHLTLPTICSV